MTNARKFLRTVSCALVIFAGFLSSLHAQTEAQRERREIALTLMFFTVQSENTVEDLRERMRQLFFRLDFDGGGITDRDRQQKSRFDAAKSRSLRIMTLLNRDLDGDGTVTKLELLDSLSPEARKIAERESRPAPPDDARIAALIEQQIGDLMSRDLNGDGRITSSELVQEARQYFAGKKLATSWISPMPTGAFDLDGDGVVSAAEFENEVDAIIMRFDSDGDGRFSNDERNRFLDAADRSRREMERRESGGTR